jgi:hypothetical protein
MEILASGNNLAYFQGRQQFLTLSPEAVFPKNNPQIHLAARLMQLIYQVNQPRSHLGIDSTGEGLMRKNIPIIALVFMVVLPSLASAVYLDSVTGTADCNGWTADVEVTFRSGARWVELEYVVALLDATGLEVERFEYAAEVDIPSQTTVVYSFADEWTTDLPDGLYTLNCEVVLLDIFPDGQNRFEDGFTTEFTCGDNGGGGEDPEVTDFCPHGSGFWKNHPADWPVMSLDLGSDHLDQTALLAILKTPVHGDATRILARPLIAAKLNLATGAGDDIAEVIAAADAYLVDHPVGSNPRQEDRKIAFTFMSDLGAYNSADCTDASESPEGSFAPAAGKTGPAAFDKAAAVEVTSLGSLKALYR